MVEVTTPPVPITFAASTQGPLLLGMELLRKLNGGAECGNRGAESRGTTGGCKAPRTRHTAHSKSLEKAIPMAPSDTASLPWTALETL